jgi:hypothetical protein
MQVSASDHPDEPEIHYRAETRFALGVIYPDAICLVDLTDAA